MGKQAFDKFINKQSPAKKKEAIRQQKRKLKKEARERSEAIFGKKQTERKQTPNYQVTKNIQIGKTEAPEETLPTNRSSAPSGRSASKSFSSTPERKYTSQRSAKNEVAPPPAKTTSVKSKTSASAEAIPLNKFIAHSGVCARREAAEIVKAGHVTVNGDKVFEPAFRVTENDKVVVKGKQVFLKTNMVYILLNKPKDYITTAKDPEGRKTVFDLVKDATQERVYPVGRLDRNTTGVLLLTNDGELAQKLTHPSFEIKKIYEVRLDQPLAKKDFDQIIGGMNLEDGFVKADSLAYADVKDKSVVGIEIHSGRNRIVRRIFEHLGYKVKNLDRVMFANLTKKNVDRGHYRFLTEKEVRLLKYLNQSFLKKHKEA